MHCCFAYDAREGVCGCACDCMFCQCGLWCVFHCVRYDISLLNQSIVCGHTTSFLSLSLISPQLVYLSHSLCLFFLCVFTFLFLYFSICRPLLLLCSLCETPCLHLAVVGMTPSLSLLQDMNSEATV